MRSLKLGIPKGSLFKKTTELLEKVGIEIKTNGRSFRIEVHGIGIFSEGMILRPEDIPIAIERGILDCGITGWDWVVENGMENKLVKIVELSYSKKTMKPVKIVVFGKNNILYDNDNIAVTSEYINLARKTFRKAKIYFSSGTTEAKVVADMYTYGIGVTETGKSLEENDLQLVKIILISPVVLIARENLPEIKLFGQLLRGALNAEKLQLIKIDVSKGIKKSVINILPAIESPTVNALADGSFAIETVAQKHATADLLVKLQELGAKGIIVQDINLIL